MNVDPWRRSEALHKELEDTRRRRGWHEEHPTYLREYCGIWVRDLDALVYALQARNIVPGSFKQYKHLAGDWVYTLGVDVGVRSATAFSVVAHSMEIGQAYVVFTEKYGGKDGDKSGVPISRCAAEIDKIQHMYPITKVILDTGGMGAAYQETLAHDYGVWAEAARKHEKMAHIEGLNSDLRSGILKICRPDNECLIEEMNILQFGPDASDRGKFIEDRRYENHASDASLYAWRGGYHKDFEWEENAPREGTPEYEDAIREASFDSCLKQAGLGPYAEEPYGLDPEQVALYDEEDDHQWF
jgi:hypothetical protein